MKIRNLTTHVHDFQDPTGFEDGTYGWRACACSGSVPGHPEVADPAGGPSCGMAYRLCRTCDDIDERPLSELDIPERRDQVEAVA